MFFIDIYFLFFYNEPILFFDFHSPYIPQWENPALPVSAYERRKFVRVDINFEARVNRQIRAAMRKLSLGGCLIECNEVLDPINPLQLEFSTHEEQFSLSGHLIHSLGQNQYGIRFHLTEDDIVFRLVSAIQKIQDTAIARRSTRLKIQRKALVDNEPSVLTDLSEGGGSLQTHRYFNYGDIVEVRFFLDEEVIHLAAQVRWKNPQGIGVEFLSPDPTQVVEIATFIVKQITKPPGI
jgi:hypothetical protein